MIWLSVRWRTLFTAIKPGYLEIFMLLSKNLILAHDIRLMAQHADFSDAASLAKFEKWVEQFLDSHYPGIRSIALDIEGLQAIEDFLKSRQQYAA